MLILLGSPKYFGSANCLRELAAATALGTPLVLVHEQDLDKNGAPLEALRAACPNEHRRFVFDDRTDELVAWHRIAEFQQVLLAQVRSLYRPHHSGAPCHAASPSPATAALSVC